MKSVGTLLRGNFLEKIFWVSFLLLSAMASSAFAGVVHLNCHGTDENRQRFEFFNITYAGREIQELAINGYDIIRGGKQVPDNVNGHSAFDIKVSRLEQDRGVLKLRVELRDYSEQFRYYVYLSEAVREVSVVTLFQTSDGDNLLHVSSQTLNCQ